MALSKEEQEILQYGKANGKTPEEVRTAVARYRTEQTPPPAEQAPTPPAPTKSFMEKAEGVSQKATDFLGLGGATQTFGNILARRGIGTDVDTETTKKYVPESTVGQTLGAVTQAAIVPASFALTGGVGTLGKVAVGAGLGYAYDVGQDLIDKKKASQVITPGVGTVIGAAAPLLGPAIGALKRPVSNALTTGANAIAKTIPESTIVQGAKQTATDFAERVPRFMGRMSEAVEEQAIKSQRIKTATPSVAQALKAELPESFIQIVPNADKVTKQAFREVLDIAEAPKVTLGQKSNPAIVAGNYAVKQFDTIEKQRKTIGTAIGEATAKLPKGQTVDMKPAYNQLDNLLVDQGITPVYSKKGIALDFTRSKLAPKQRQVVQDLYKLATEAGDTLSPAEVHKKDQLFSALQREAKTDQVADIFIDLPDGNKTDLFRAFRDVYSNQLDTISPEIKGLNSKYRNVSTLIDDIENSIFKTPNFEITKNTDQAEFAKVNLRRIFGESQSSPAYEAIADEMDTISRQLGYGGASPKEVAAFAQEIRQLYPETMPKTGFQGGISGVLDLAGKVLGAGASDTRDQQKALRALLEAT